MVGLVAEDMALSSSSGTVLIILSAMEIPEPACPEDGPGLYLALLSAAAAGVGLAELPKYWPNTICFLPPELMSSSMAALPSAVRNAISSAAGVDLRRPAQAGKHMNACMDQDQSLAARHSSPPVPVGVITAAMAAGGLGACWYVKDPFPFTWTGGKAHLLPEEPSAGRDDGPPTKLLLRLTLPLTSVSVSGTADVLEKDLRENGDLDALPTRS